MSSPRVNISKQQPDLHKAAVAMAGQAHAAAVAAGLSERLVELVKIRVSQLNGCAFCLRAHTADATLRGETAERLAVLPAWRETAYFSADERAALALAESVTRIGDAAAAEAAAAEAGALTAAQTAAVAWVAVTINAFNRIAITSHYDVAPSARVEHRAPREPQPAGA